MTQKNSSVWKRLVAVFAGVVVTGTGGTLTWFASAQAAHEKQAGHPVIVERVDALVSKIDECLAAQRQFDIRQAGIRGDVAAIKGDIKLLLERTDWGRP